MSTVFIVAVKEEVESVDNILGIPIIYSGVGKINATIAACKAASLNYTNIINIGSSGSISRKVGDIIKIGTTFQDIDCTPLCNYGETLFEENSNKIIIDSYSENSCFTTDYFVDLSQKEKYSEYYLNMITSCTIFDMECFAIAKVCKFYNLNFSSYKWISDSGDSSDWISNCKVGLEKIKEIIGNEIKKERI